MAGWIIENKHPYFFALNLEGSHNLNMQPIRINILKGILKKLGFLEGKM
jgi:beta-lactamase class D